MSMNESFWGNYKPSRVIETAWNLYKFSKRSDETRAETWWDLSVETQAEFTEIAVMLIPESLHPNHNYRDQHA